MFVAMVGTGLAGTVSNCNRNCSDGTSEMYAACVFGGLSLASLIGAAFGRTPKLETDGPFQGPSSG